MTFKTLSLVHFEFIKFSLETAFWKFLQKFSIKKPFDSDQRFIWRKRRTGECDILLLWFTDRIHRINVEDNLWNILDVNRGYVTNLTTSNVILYPTTIQSIGSSRCWKKQVKLLMNSLLKENLLKS